MEVSKVPLIASTWTLRQSLNGWLIKRACLENVGDEVTLACILWLNVGIPISGSSIVKNGKLSCFCVGVVGRVRAGCVVIVLPQRCFTHHV